MHEEKTKAQLGTRSLQRATVRTEKEIIRQKIEGIRQGHLTGGYCDTQALQVEEKKLDRILRAELTEAKEKFGYSPDPKFKPPEIRAIELELNGFSWKPELVVKEG